MSTVSGLARTARSLEGSGVAFAPEIARAARRHHLDARLLAAVAAQETGGPGSNAGRNVVGDRGHGRGLFQIDDRFHAFARTPAAMQPAANADYAAGLLSTLLDRYGGNVRRALSAYNAGSPDAAGTRTRWQDGRRLSYADSVLRHYAQLGGTTPEALQETACAEGPAERESVNALASLADLRPGTPPASRTWQQVAAGPRPDFGSLVAP